MQIQFKQINKYEKTLETTGWVIIACSTLYFGGHFIVYLLK